MTSHDGFRISRTGNCFSFSSNEFSVTFPDGHIDTIWSPPWHELSEHEEDLAALSAAREMYRKNIHKEPKAKVRLP